MYEQKDVVLIPFPYSDLTGTKRRPALIISNGTINKTEDRICCLVTSKKTTQGIPIMAKTGRLPFRSWAKPHRIFTIHKGIIRKRLCTVTDETHACIIERLNTHIEQQAN